MKFKTKYNIGDIVRFYNVTSSRYQIGRINRIFISYSAEYGETIKYDIEKIKINHAYIADEVTILEGAIRKKINKKAFEKEYAKECAREIAKGDEVV